MELIKKDIHTINLTVSKYTQITVDEDFDLPESVKMEKIITYHGNTVIEEVVTEENRIKIRGCVCFSVLYKLSEDDEGKAGEFSAEIPFEDVVNTDGAESSGMADVRSTLEDLSVTVLNPSKISVKGLIGNSTMVYSEDTVNAAARIDNGQGLECLYEEITFTKMPVHKNENIRLREENEIPRSKPNIKEIIWHSLTLGNIETRLSDDKLEIIGDYELFIIYVSEEEGLPLQYLNVNEDFSETVSVPEAEEEMILVVRIEKGRGEVSVRPDSDGEPRSVLIDYSLSVNVKGYVDESMTLISDMYSPEAELNIMTEDCRYENLLIKNSARTRITGRDRLRGSNSKIMQVCFVEGDVEIDNIHSGEESVVVEGVVKAVILYISADDTPFYSWHSEIPFEYTADTVSADNEASIRVIPSLEQISVQLLGIDEVEIKAEINLDITVFSKGKISAVTDVMLLPVDKEKKAEMPEIVGYIVKPEDNLWAIARKYYSTTGSIKALNNLENDEIMPGDKLLIMKA